MNRRFPVWAPQAAQVTLVVGQGRAELPLTRGENGWWALDQPWDGGPDPADYGFLVDGNGPFADPRSLRQPRGVHELGREFDPARYAWGDDGWRGRDLTGAVIYELHVGTFTPEGTLDSAIRRLDHLVRLGVDAIELLPVNAFNGTHGWGYDGVLWYAVHEPYGGPEAYQRFVDACHARGLAVVQDVVYNHLGPSGNHLPDFGPYLGSGAANTWGDALNLDGPLSDEVRRYIIDNAMYWLRDMHADGLRLDAVHALRDARALHLLEELAARVDELAAELGRPLTLIAESDLNDPKLIRSRAAHGYGLDAQWDDDVHHAVHANVTGETVGYYADFGGLGALVKVFERGWFHDGTWSSFRERHHGRPLDPDIPFRRLVAFAQDHDQVGNRAVGDRMSAQVGEGSLAAAAALVLLGPFTPMLFMGEEWGARTPWQFFTSHPEPELGEATARGRIAEFARMGWDPAVVPDPQDPATFARSRLDWSEPEREPHAGLLAFYTDLIALRRELPVDAPAREVDADEARGVFAFSRGPLRVTVALRPGPVEVPEHGGLVLAYGEVRAGAAGLHLEGPGAAIVRLE
ncbi:malto-oligosyltrehalose trehalohydrolase [Gryllotalpicola ginsengisoli]|uniref:malto-oligosyltrehalose trehalohydrolase n=1 Tax=Gryllotalpicola ginsengisoli TaxID=444608 RepID=UPI0003B4FEAB|nr:malto-oligosyltrehalose trehalohydrolase [Gryllotalpicola ginsengisoli]